MQILYPEDVRLLRKWPDEKRLESESRCVGVFWRQETQDL